MEKVTRTPEPIFRRLLKPLDEFSDWSVLVPVGLAVAVLLLIVLFRRDKRLSTLLWGSVIVGVLSAAYVALALTFKSMLGTEAQPNYAWWVILGPCLGVALFYVAMMYITDCKTIHPAWATFLGLLRLGVYALLAWVFLLPSLLFYDETFQGFKTVLLLDVSDSMIKGLGENPTEDQDPKTVPTRQQKVLDWLTKAGDQGTPIEQILRKSPLTIYRFGGVLDEKNKVVLNDVADWKARNWDVAKWREFLFPEAPKEAKAAHTLNGELAETDPIDAELQRPHKSHDKIALKIGKTYYVYIEDASEKEKGQPGFTPALRILDPAGREVGQSEDAGKFKTRFKLTPSAPEGVQEVSYRIIATAEKGAGPYVIRAVDLEEEQRLVAEKTLVSELRNGTNIGKAMRDVADLESNAGKFVQAMIVVSEGQSNQGSQEDTQVFEAKRLKASHTMHVFTLGIGTYLPPVSLRVEDLQGPRVARPDDKFPIRVPVRGENLGGRTFKVFLDMERLSKKDEKPFRFGPIEKTFKEGGDRQEEIIEFEMELKKLFKEELEKAHEAAKVKYGKDPAWTAEKIAQEAYSVLEGKYQFTARVPRLPGESFQEAEHKSKPFIVHVQRAKPRVLLFAGGPSLDYQFLRTLLFREAAVDRLELSVLLQTTQEGTDQDVPKEKLLTKFPAMLEKSSKPGESLADFDLIIAIDPDWTVLTGDQQKLVEKWVDIYAGGIIFVAGPVHTFHLSKPGGIDIGPLQTIFPVHLKDSRLHGLGVMGHDFTRPYALEFTTYAKQYDFLNLEESPKDATSGWDKFFWGDSGKPEPGKDAKPVRGFYNYYPVEKLKAGSIVLASFLGNEKSKINDGRDPQPYIVLMKYGQGKTMYIGSAESRRLRQYKELLHERFWIKLSRFMAASTSMKGGVGYALMSSEYSVGTIYVEFQLKAENGLPLPQDARPEVKVTLPDDFDPRLDDVKTKIPLQPKPSQGEWRGVFAGTLKVRTPGKYTLTVPVPGTNQSVTHDIYVRKANLEMDNLRTDFPALFHLASTAKPVLAKLTKTEREPLDKLFKKAPEGAEARAGARDEAGRLFLRLENADHLPTCIFVEEPKKIGEKGKTSDAGDEPWDAGWKSGLELSLYQIILWVMDGVGFLVIAILLITRRFWAALAVLVGGWAAVHGLLWLNASLAEPSMILNVLAIAVGALALLALGGLMAWEKDWVSLGVLLGVSLFLVGAYFGDIIQAPDAAMWRPFAGVAIPTGWNLYLALGAAIVAFVGVHVLLILGQRWGCLATFWISKLALVAALLGLSWLAGTLTTADNAGVVGFLAGMGALLLLVLAEGAFSIALVLRQQWVALAVYWGAVVLGVSVWVYQGRSIVLPVDFSLVLMLIVGLLSLEWLLRKLLRLA